MIAIATLRQTLSTRPQQEYQCQANLNLYDSPALTGLTTQAIAQRQLRIQSIPADAVDAVKSAAIQVQLCEDHYPGWVAVEDLDLLAIAEIPYEAIALPETEIRSRLPRVIAFAYNAMKQPNHYLWGGTVGPNYDCSGLVQTAFASVAIWLPRDAYQQEAFVQAIAIDRLESGDLVFFGTGDRCTHVGLYLGNGHYIHSSGKDQGRNGIGIDRLSEDSDPISQTYYRQMRGAGRVVASFQPQIHSVPQTRP
jgi:hypothetical protein